MFPDLVVTSLVKFRLRVILPDPWAVQTLRYYLTVTPDTSVHRLPSLSSPRPMKQPPSDFMQNTFKRPRLLVIWTLHLLWHEEEVGPCLIARTLYDMNPHSPVFLSLLTRITSVPLWTEHDVRVWLYVFTRASEVKGPRAVKFEVEFIPFFAESAQQLVQPGRNLPVLYDYRWLYYEKNKSIQVLILVFISECLNMSI